MEYTRGNDLDVKNGSPLDLTGVCTVIYSYRMQYSQLIGYNCVAVLHGQMDTATWIHQSTRATLVARGKQLLCHARHWVR